MLILAGRSWEATHLDWKRRIAYVEPTDEKGRSRWLGAGQFLSFTVCRAIRSVLASNEEQLRWSQRARSRIAELRGDFPWVSHNQTTLVARSNREIEWWTFAGGIANTILGSHLGKGSRLKPDNCSIKLSGDTLTEAEAGVSSLLQGQGLRAIPNEEAIANLKFVDCLPRELAQEIYVTRFNDTTAIGALQSEGIRLFTEAPNAS